MCSGGIVVRSGRWTSRRRYFSRATIWPIAAFHFLFLLATGQAQEYPSSGPVHSLISDDEGSSPSEELTPANRSAEFRPASLLQPAPLLPPARAEPEVPLPSPATEFARSLLGGGIEGPGLTTGQLALRGREAAPSISGSEAQGRLSSDAGSLLFKSPAAISSGVQRRNPIINDPRVRGSRVGSLAANGSYWIPARIDLDTMLSKIDSRLVQQMTVVPGPYNVF